MSTITAGNVTVSCALSADTTGNLVFQSGGNVTAMTIDTSQNVGIGTSSPTRKLTVYGNTAQVDLSIVSSTTGLAVIQMGDTAADNQGQIIYRNDTDAMTFTVNAAERARIDSSGNLLVNTTTKFGRVTSENSTAFDPTVSGNIVNTAFTARGSYSGGVSVIDSSGNQGYSMWSQAGGADFFIRRATTTGSYTGGVFISNAAGSWSSASDERLKNIHRPIENAADKLSGLRCVFGEYKDNPGIEHPFLIAQDVQVVFPEVVNEFDKENGYLGMSYTDMVPILVKAIQEQQQMIETLQAEVAALKGVKA